MRLLQEISTHCGAPGKTIGTGLTVTILASCTATKRETMLVSSPLVVGVYSLLNQKDGTQLQLKFVCRSSFRMLGARSPSLALQRLRGFPQCSDIPLSWLRQ